MAYRSRWHWCAQVVRHISYKPERQAVERELLDHLEDAAQAIAQRQSVSHEQAEQQAIAAMGDPDALGKSLNRLHYPVLGQLLRLSRWVIALVCVVALYHISQYGLPQNLAGSLIAQKNEYTEGIYQNKIYSSELGYAYTIGQWRPQAKVRAGGYHFSVSRMALQCWQPYPPPMTDVQPAPVEYTLWLTLESWSLRPWLKAAALSQGLTAMDSLGNIYANPSVPGTTRPWLYVSTQSPTLFVSRYECQIELFDPEAQWIELRYQNAHRSFALRIPLEGD